MRITESQLRSIIRKELSKSLLEGALYVTRGSYGPTIKDDRDRYVNFGEMVAALLDSGMKEIFRKPQGLDPRSLSDLQKSHLEGIQGGMKNWDADVFSNYYNVDYDRVINLYANLMNYEVVEVNEEESNY